MSSGRGRTKVAVVIGSLDRGGAEQDIVRVFPRLDPTEFEVVVIAFSSPGSLAPAIEKAGIRVLSRHVDRPEKSGPWLIRRARDSWYALGLIPWLSKALREESVDIAHFFLPYSYGYGMLACALMRRPPKRVMSRLSLNFYKRTNRILSWLERVWFHRAVDIAIANSLPILEELAEEGVSRERLRLVHNGIDADAFLRADGERERTRRRLKMGAEEYAMLSVGNLHSYKGHQDLIEACALVQADLPASWHLHVVGRDEEGNRSAFESQARDLGLSERITFHGERDDVREFLMAADVLVHPSRHEGLPNAILEAMSASLPVVATQVGGIPEAVETEPDDAATGWLVDASDPCGLARALLLAATDDGRRVRRGEAGRIRAESEFSIERCVSAYRDLYRSLM